MSWPDDQMPLQHGGGWRQRQCGVTSLEYALIAFLIAISIIGGIVLVGDSNLSNWSNVADKVGAAIKTALGF